MTPWVSGKSIRADIGGLLGVGNVVGSTSPPWGSRRNSVARRFPRPTTSTQLEHTFERFQDNPEPRPFNTPSDLAGAVIGDVGPAWSDGRRYRWACERIEMSSAEHPGVRKVITGLAEAGLPDAASGS